MTVHVTHHALDRYCERVGAVSRDQAERTILAASRGIEAAAAFGSRVVRLPNGARLICAGAPARVGKPGAGLGERPIRVVTLLAPGHIEGGHYPRLSSAAHDRGRH
jgi:hypothetical protein